MTMIYFSRNYKIYLSIVTTFVMIGIVGTTIYQEQEAHATGCPVSFVNEHIDQALAAFEAKNAAELKNQLDLAKEALSAAAEESE